METHTVEIQWAWDHPIVQELLLKYYRERLFGTGENAEKSVEAILSLAGVRAPGKVLDIGCGLGHQAIAFARRGFQVLAFDPGDKYLAVARENIARAKAYVELRQMACHRLAEVERYALAWAGWYCPGQLTPAEVVQDFRRIYNALVPGGWFVSTFAGKVKVPPAPKERNWAELSDCFVLSEKWADETCAHEVCWFVYPGKDEVLKVVEVDRMYGFREIPSLLKQAGFVEIGMAESLADLTAPAREGRRFVFWCRRPAGGLL
jgi:SAM-dependent methyltransferase